MDFLTHQALSRILPPDAYAFVQTNILHPQSQFQLLFKQSTVVATNAVSATLPYLDPLIERVSDALHDNSGAVGVVVALGVITAVVMIMNWIRRMIMWWARFTMVLAFYAAIVVVIAIAWERGPARSLRDVVVVASKIVGYLASLREVWVQEYDRYESQGNPRMRR